VGERRKKRPATPDGRSPEEKLRLLLEVKGLPDAKRGKLLRREGVHDGDLERWEQEALSGLRGAETNAVDETRSGSVSGILLGRNAPATRASIVSLRLR
jgi:hypothetical protein